MMNELLEVQQKLESVAKQVEQLQSLITQLMAKEQPAWQSPISARFSPARQHVGGYGSRYVHANMTQQPAGPRDDTMNCTGRNHAFAEFRRPF